MTEPDRARVAVVGCPGAADVLEAAPVETTATTLDDLAAACPDCVVLGDPTAERVAAARRVAPGAAVLGVTDDPETRTAALEAGARDVLVAAAFDDPGGRGVRRTVDAARGAAFEARRRVGDAAADATAIVGADGDLRVVDDGFAALAGADAGALVGEPAATALDARHADLVLGAAEGLVESPESVARFDHETDDGRRLATRVAPVVRDGSLVAAAVAVRDVTDREVLAAELTRRAERLEEVASLVSHDLRNPLNVVSGRLQLAEETGDVSHVEPARRAALRLCDLVEDVQALARRGRRVDATETEPVDLALVARVAWGGVDASGATLDAEPVAGVTVDGHEERLSELFRRLFENVAVHGGPEATATVEPTPDGFAVVDDGTGLDPDATVDRLLDPGYTTDDDRTGFGLAVVCAIADAHGWRMRVERDGGLRVAFDTSDAPAPGTP